MRHLAILCILSLILSGFAVAAEDYSTAIVGDWKRQEQNAGRDISSAEALRALVVRARVFHEWAAARQWCPAETLAVLERRLANAETGSNTDANANTDTDAGKKARAQKYLDLRSAVRDAALASPKIKGQPIVFLKMERFTCQMLHEHISYYYHATGMYGGGLYLLDEPGKSFKTTSLTDGRFPKGVFSTLSLSWDAKSVYFAFADMTDVPDNAPRVTQTDLKARPYMADFDSGHVQKKEGKFHLYKMTLNDRNVTQLTTGPADDFDPVELPDGDLVFMSTRRGGYGRCHGSWEPLQVHTLHRLDVDGQVHCLSWHETNEWNPSILNDGRILYTRWDYVDRSASNHHGLWITNPDGTTSTSLFGNYTYDVNACYQGKAIPDSKKILFVGGSHHLDIGGTLVMLDPSKIHYDPETAKDDLAAIKVVTPDVELPEVKDAPTRVCSHYYHSPWPLAEEVWLTAYSHDALGGYLAKTESCGKLRLYYRDCFGNMELLFEDDSAYSSMFPIPVAARTKPPVIPSQLPENAKDFGSFMLSNVYESLVPFPKDRPIKELRIFQLLPKAPGYRAHTPPTGHPYAANARMLLGSVPVEKDGSAYFKVPARKPVYFQAVDEHGKAVQSMRSIVYLQPGENRGCIGCHEQALTVQANTRGRSLAALRAPSELVPGPQYTRPFSYPLFVQPILDRNCVSCHSGRKDAVKPALTGKIEGTYTQSYNELKPWLRWYEWLARNSYREISTLPGQCGSDISPLANVVSDKNHKDLKISNADIGNLYLWLDANVPFYGVYDDREQEKQLHGEIVPAPALQ